MTTPAERRTFTRVETRHPVELLIGSNPPSSGELVDVSLAGMLVRVTPRPDVGTSVRTAISLGDPQTIRLEMSGEVVRQDSRGVGIRITSMPIETYHHMVRMVQVNAADADEVADQIRHHLGLKPVEPGALVGWPQDGQPNREA